MFSKICGDIHKARCTTGVKDTGGKFEICHRCQLCRWQTATGINNIGGKFATSVNDTSAKIFPIEDFFHWPPVSLTPVVRLELQISPRIYTYWYNQGLGGN
jgi:hypothetical protein